MREPLASRITRHFLPVEATVLGERLGAFTLWHWQQLAAFESPYAELSAGDGIEDLLLAVRICAAPVFSQVSLRLTWRERLARKLKTFHFAPRLPEEEHVFFEWMMYQLTPPAKWQKGGGKSINCPPWLYIVSSLVEQGMHPRTAWALPVGEARCYLAAISVNHGGGDFLTDEEVDRMIAQGACTLEDLGLA
jgi:hypothetical protein